MARTTVTRKFWFNLALLLGLATASTACDTVAEISFKQRDFLGFSTVGVVQWSDCNASDTEVAFRFSPFDGDGRFIAPNEVVNEEAIRIGGSNNNFNSDSIDFTDAFLYPAPDRFCSSDVDCADLAGFSCVSINPFSSSARRACGRSVEVEVFQGQVLYNPPPDTGRMSIGVVMDHSLSLFGVINADNSFDRSKSSDPNDVRISAARAFVSKFQRTPVAEDSRMCVVSYGGEGAAAVHFSPTPTSCMTSNYSDIDTLLSQLAIGEDGASPVWAALEETINQQLATAAEKRVVILFTDGLDDGSVSASFASAVTAAQSNNVAVHIIQLDNPPSDELGVREFTMPEDQFAQAACGTNGSFQYATGPDDLRVYYDNLTLNVSQNYETRLQIAALSDVPPGAYRIAAGVRITMSGTQRTLELAGDKTERSSMQQVDDRIAVFARPVPPRPVDTDGTDD